ncbi:MAG: hypothetical protein ABIJ14_01555 [Nanoarchaeota archaeon]
MENEGRFRKKLSEQQILNLSDEQREKIQRFNEFATRLEEAEANKESQQKLRVLFERAPEETLPFLVYCIYVGATGLISFFFLISKFEGVILYILIGLLIFILILPIIILPKLHLGKFFSWMFKLKEVRKDEK